ncbi:MAG TPA: hypothetical protein VLD61_11105 [Methylomirabilota bacterium]|nr:hypothetical protein [Methylomirabilota bacterium]
MTRSPIALAALLLGWGLTACAGPSKGEYRAGLYRHPRPAYSFQVPSGWRPVTLEKGAAFAVMARVLRSMDADGQRRALAVQRERLVRMDSALISDGDAGILVESRRDFTGVGIPRDAHFSPVQRQQFTDAVKARSPDTMVHSVETVPYGALTALRATLTVRGVDATLVMFVDGPDGVMLWHVGTPDDASTGLADFESLLRSFRFGADSA